MNVSWKKVLLIGAIATVTPGGFILLGLYGLKKLAEKGKEDGADPKP